MRVLSGFIGMFKNYLFCWFLFDIFVDSLPTSKEYFQLSVAHVNDFHARFEETDEWGGLCKANQTCIGGFPRMYQTLMSLKKYNPDTLLLNAGDNFQGTIWYSLFKWNVTQHFFNKIPFDAFVLGNHEFDDTVEGAVKFMKHLRAPFVLANVDDTDVPDFQRLFTKSIVVEKNGKKIGIIGVLLKNVEEKSKIGKLKFLDESESINREAERLVKEHNVFTNIVLSHCGYILEKEMARKASGKISLIVGGHSHSLLWNGDNPPSKSEKPEGPYPTVVHNVNRQKVLVVQALSFARYVGNITIVYDKNGEIHEWSGNPIFQNSSLPLNKEINEEMKVWKQKINERGNRVIGQTLTDLSVVDCRRKECSLGNFMTDAMVYSELQYGIPWSNAPLAVINCGSLKKTISKGNITYNELLEASPFNNDIVVGRLKGKFLIEALKHALNYFAQWESRLLQVSGIQVVYDMKKPVENQLVSAKVRCSECRIPEYLDIVPDKEYSVVIHDFLEQGGDGFTMFRDNFTVVKRIGSQVDVHMEYISKNSPIWSEVGERITILGDENILSKYRKR